MAKNKKRKGQASKATIKNQDESSIKASVERVPRNPFALDPLMRKSGAHQKSKSSDRAKANRETQRQVRDWSNS